MDAIDPIAEWRNLSERYRQMTDEELLDLADESSELTDAAQQALSQEMSHRGLKIAPKKPTAPPIPEPEYDSAYAEDRELIDYCTVWSLPDALQVQRLLDAAGIPFFMGAEKATGVDAVTSDFTKGVSVQIMRIGVPWARQAMQHYAPENDPDAKQVEELDELPVRCPKCHSTEVIFGSLGSEEEITEGTTSKLDWTCDSCGHRWEDDGVVKEA